MSPMEELRQLNHAVKALSVSHPLREQIDQRIEDLSNQSHWARYDCICCGQRVVFNVSLGEAIEWTTAPTGVCGGCAA